MRRHRLNMFEPKAVRDKIREAVQLSNQIHEIEKQLVLTLAHIDRDRFYVRVGFYTLSGFCKGPLKFSKFQTQRIVTQVRKYRLSVHTPERFETTAHESDPDLKIEILSN